VKYISHHQKFPAPTPMRKDILNCNSVIPRLVKILHSCGQEDWFLEYSAIESWCSAIYVHCA